MSVFGRGNSPTDSLFLNRQVFFPTNILFFHRKINFFFPDDDFFFLFCPPIGPRAFFPPPLLFFGLALQGIPDISDMSVFGRGNSPTIFFFFNRQFFFQPTFCFSSQQTKSFSNGQNFHVPTDTFFPPRAWGAGFPRLPFFGEISPSPQPKYH